MRFIHIGTAVLALATAHSAYATTWTVIKGGGGDFETIQSAVNTAHNGDEILVLPGVYTSTTSAVVDFMGKEIRIVSKDGPNTTFIDGQLMRRGVYFGSGENALAVLSGFTITNCKAPMHKTGPSYGGGVFCESGSSPWITNCVITNNVAPNDEDSSSLQPGHGGGVALLQFSHPTLESCVITNNIAKPYNGKWGITESYGGGVFCGVECTLTILNSTIEENTACNGAGFYCRGNRLAPSNTVIEDCTIAHNETYEIDSEGGGGIMCFSDAIERVTRCTIKNNTATTGGGIRVTKKGAYPLIDECNISNNIARSASWNGGGLCSDGSDTGAGGAKPVLSDNLFCGNVTEHIYGHYTDIGGNVFHEDCCESDITGDGVVGVDDILVLVSLWDTNDDQADVNGDGIVGTDDLLLVIANWGNCG